MGTVRAAAALTLGALLLSGCLPDAEQVAPVAEATVTAAPSVAAVPVTGVETSAPAPSKAPALLQATGGDGDSFRDTAGGEYRLGLIDTPEVGRCFAGEATAERKRLVADGFRVDVYTTDRYGRQVAVVYAADGTNVNVHLARHGFADDRYLAQFRHENTSLAAELDRAYAAAKRERAGMWRACGNDQLQGIAAAPPAAAPPAAAPPAAAAPAPAGDCHPDYTTCIPVKGDGSGRGEVNDLDCGDIGQAVTLRARGVDPYRLDADGDGTGCDS